MLISEEQIRGLKVIKFPGGGLEWGEGTLDGLKREWMEEMNIKINVEEHFYTTDFFQPSAFDDSQVISIYYKVQVPEPLILPYRNGNEHFYFAPVDERLETLLTLPIDKIVGLKLAAFT